MFTIFLHKLHDSFAHSALEAYSLWTEAARAANDVMEYDVANELLERFKKAEQKLNFVRDKIGLNQMVLLSIGWFEKMDDTLDGIVGARRFEQMESIFITNSARDRWLRNSK